MPKYNVWWDGEGEVFIGEYEEKDHAAARRRAIQQLCIRKVKNGN